MSKKLSHIDDRSRPRMVDVSAKGLSLRTAVAAGFIDLQPSTVKLVRSNKAAKGNVLVTAELAGIQAAKRTPELIPLCHQLSLSRVGVEARLKKNGVEIVSEAVCTGQTGVEMEALTAVSVALLTVYDMCKAVDKSMRMRDIRLISKTKTHPAGE